MPSYTVATAHSVGFLSGSEARDDGLSSFASIGECFQLADHAGAVADTSDPSDGQADKAGSEIRETGRIGSSGRFDGTQEAHGSPGALGKMNVSRASPGLERSGSAFERNASFQEKRRLRVPPRTAEYYSVENGHFLSVSDYGLEAKPQAPDQLYSIRQVPHYLRMPDIWEGYRASGLSTRHYWKSVFRIHNETFNFWSHAIPAILALVIVMPYTMLVIMRPLSIQAQISVFLYMLAAFFCFCFSAVYHAVGCQSQEMHRHWLMVDQVGTLAYMTGSFLPGMVIVSLRFVRMGQFCLFLTFCNFVLGTRFLVKSSKSERQCIKTRDRLFVFTASWSLIPYMIFAYAERAELLGKVFLVGVLVTYATQALAFAFYKLRIPERFGPGEFDCWGNSHHYWHLLSCCGGLLWLVCVVFFFLQAFASNYHVRTIDELGFLHKPF
ncbi:Adiponectin receptor protein [Porphyridium purpureum]|uniref:Adiponectin receptor protein n=1 Tax=Porphyridium purpureum TaxID=35688 RepID=A0A5J4YXT3_PORPP|nr:Adiponectin receptor protein [Porphyridium purpureum]|eukprot:POR2197..scf209_3